MNSSTKPQRIEHLFVASSEKKHTCGQNDIYIFFQKYLDKGLKSKFMGTQNL